jgi:tetratricopeptide (TPR) repeat protein
MPTSLSSNEEAQLQQTIEMFEVITQSQPQDYQSLEILKEAYFKLGRKKEVVNTAKRIAQAYVELGQLSSAILEYESILQQFPGDADVKKALADIENKANSFAPPPPVAEPGIVEPKPVQPVKPGKATAKTPTQPSQEIDDGRKVMEKLFVEGKFVSTEDFNQAWPTPNLEHCPTRPQTPFIQVLADLNLMPIEQSLKLLCEKARLPFLPIEKYDVDIELARSFPKELCRRWCLLPFDRMSKSVLVATANPFNRQAAQDLETATDNRLLWYLASPVDLVKILRRIFL